MKDKTRKNLTTAIMLIQMILICILVFYIVPMYVLNHSSSFEDSIPDYNDTEVWREICSIENPCKWYQIGCQKYCCVMDCSEINKNAGENICMC